MTKPETQDTTAPVNPPVTDEESQETPEQRTTETPPESGGPRMFSQEEVNAIVAERVARAKRSVEAQSPPSKAEPTKSESKTETRSEVDVESIIARVTAATERKYAARELGLNADQQALLDLAYDREDPVGDPGEWVRSRAKALRWVTEPQPKAATEVPPTRTPADKVHASDAGAPTAPPVTYDDSDNPLTWSRDHINRILADKGTKEGRKYIRRRLEQAMENVRIVLPR